MSSTGTSSFSARRLLAARVPYNSVKISDATIAASMRKVVRIAYSGRLAGSREMTSLCNVAMGAQVSRAPMDRNSKKPTTRGSATKSQRLGSRRSVEAGR